MRRQTVLVVEQDAEQRQLVELALVDAGYDVRASRDVAGAVSLLSMGPCDCMIAGDILSDGRGSDLLSLAREIHPELPIILIANEGDVSDAVAALKAGAEDYLVRPFPMGLLLDRTQRLAARHAVEASGSPDRKLVARSPSMRRVLTLARNVADSRATVLVLGESGTGKERVARYVHDISNRSTGPFVAVNCAAIPNNLLESELFGHEKGAFSGADRRRIGKFEAADEGTLLLDEIGELDLLLQAKLLRVLQEYEVDRVGGNKPIPINVRVICTTNRDLRKMVDEGSFREDLYYRIHVFPLRLPALRERPDDISALIDHFVARHAETNRRAVLGVTPEALDELCTYPWPGNVRELENTIERAVLLCDGDQIERCHLATLEEGPGRPLLGRSFRASPPMVAGVSFRPGMRLQDLEREVILLTLASTEGNRTHASKMLGISIRTLRNRLQSYRAAGIEIHPPPGASC